MTNLLHMSSQSSLYFYLLQFFVYFYPYAFGPEYVILLFPTSNFILHFVFKILKKLNEESGLFTQTAFFDRPQNRPHNENFLQIQTKRKALVAHLNMMWYTERFRKLISYKNCNTDVTDLKAAVPKRFITILSFRCCHI